MPPRTTAEQKKLFWHYINDQGLSARQAAFRVGVSLTTAYAWKKAAPSASARTRELKQPAVKAVDKLCPEARRALDDFVYFRLRYMGHVTTPWQKYLAGVILGLAKTDDEEYAVVNCPPGSGKSTFFVDLACWLICRDRRVRIVFASCTADLASRYSNWVRRELTRTHKVKAKDRDLRLGRAVDGESTLIKDFGRFEPDHDSPLAWTRADFTVAPLHAEDASSDKDPTVASYGADSEVIGHRADYLFVDDLWTKKIMRAKERAKAIKEWVDDELEARLELGGVCVVIGQRLGPSDVYRHVLDKRVVDDDGLDAFNDDGTPKMKYRHIKFQAHYDELCQRRHDKLMELAYDPEQPEAGRCLLDPINVSWSRLLKIKRDRRTYEIVYQQADTTLADVLVKHEWVVGGVDPDTGENVPGCLNRNRGLRELPDGLRPPLVSVVSVDPSVDNWWAFQWYVLQFTDRAEKDWLFDITRRRMKANELLEWDAQREVFTGLMEEWQVASEACGYKITVWILEQVGAFKQLTQHDFFERWRRHHGVIVIPHSTGQNKTDDDLGIQATIPKVWRTGIIDLPYRGHAAIEAVTPLVEEVTHWPDWPADDHVLAQWFMRFNRHKLYKKPTGVVLRRDVPSWMRRDAS